MVTGVPSTSVGTRTDAAKVFAKYPDIKVVGEAVGMWSQAVARRAVKLLATRSWNDIDGLWMQVGCYTANAMQAGRKPVAALRGQGSNGGRVQMPAATAARRDGQLRAHGRAARISTPRHRTPARWR